MTPGRWQDVERLYHELVDLDPGIRAERLAAIDDGALRAEVVSLLDAGPLDPAYAAAMRDVATEAGAGRRFGAWRAIRAIGEGGMGVVYEGVRADGAFAKTVAIKVLYGGAGAVRSHDRFRQERDILARLDHPNIAHLIDGGETAAGEPFIVMEYVSGLPIGAWCAERALGREDVVRLFLRVCLAVQYAHQNRVIHRDLKPANILVTESGEPKLLDFGIAKLLDADALLTLTGVQALTPEFASPEQVQGAPITAATDVYSLGLVLYELLTGRRPYVVTQSSPAAIARTICDVEPAPPGLGGDLDRILLMSLRKDPARRYASVAAFTADLENYLENRPIAARQDTVWYRTTRFIVRNRIGVAAATAVFVALSAGIAVSQYQARRAQRRFDQVRGLANDLLTNIDARLRDLPGTTAAREEAIRTTLAYLEPLARDASDDVALQVEVASAYERVGELQRSLGDDAARGSFESAIRLVEPAAGGRQPAAVTVLATAHSQFANLLYSSGDTKGAADHARAAIQMVTDAQFSDRRMFAPAVKAESFLGRIEMESGHTRSALALLEHAVETGTRALRVAPDEGTLQQVVAARINLRADVTLLGDLPRARQLTLDTQELVRAYYAGKPETAASRELRLEAYAVAAGDTLPLDMAAWLMSKADADEAVALAEGLSSADPNNVPVGVWRQIAYEQECHVARNDPGRGVEWCQRAVEAADRLAAGNPGNTLLRRNRGLQHAFLADALRRSGAHVDAVEHATLAQRDVESSFDDQESKAGVIVAMLIVGDLELDQKDYERAATRYERARALAESLVAADPDDMRAAAFLAMACEGLGRSASGRRDPTAAREWFTKAVNIWTSWPTKAVSSDYDQAHRRDVEGLLAAVAR